MERKRKGAFDLRAGSRILMAEDRMFRGWEMEGGRAGVGAVHLSTNHFFQML